MFNNAMWLVWNCDSTRGLQDKPTHFEPEEQIIHSKAEISR